MYLFCASAVIEQLNGTQLKNLVQESGRLMDVDRHGSLAGWITHSFIKVLQPGGRQIKLKKYILFNAMTNITNSACWKNKGC